MCNKDSPGRAVGKRIYSGCRANHDQLRARIIRKTKGCGQNPLPLLRPQVEVLILQGETVTICAARGTAPVNLRATPESLTSELLKN